MSNTQSVRYAASCRSATTGRRNNTYMFGNVEPRKPKVAIRTTPGKGKNILNKVVQCTKVTSTLSILTFIVDNKLPKVAAVSIQFSRRHMHDVSKSDVQFPVGFCDSCDSR